MSISPPKTPPPLFIVIKPSLSVISDLTNGSSVFPDSSQFMGKKHSVQVDTNQFPGWKVPDLSKVDWAARLRALQQLVKPVKESKPEGVSKSEIPERIRIDESLLLEATQLFLNRNFSLVANQISVEIKSDQVIFRKIDQVETLLSIKTNLMEDFFNKPDADSSKSVRFQMIVAFLPFTFREFVSNQMGQKAPERSVFLKNSEVRFGLDFSDQNLVSRRLDHAKKSWLIWQELRQSFLHSKKAKLGVGFFSSPSIFPETFTLRESDSHVDLVQDLKVEKNTKILTCIENERLKRDSKAGYLSITDSTESVVSLMFPHFVADSNRLEIESVRQYLDLDMSKTPKKIFMEWMNHLNDKGCLEIVFSELSKGILRDRYLESEALKGALKAERFVSKSSRGWFGNSVLRPISSFLNASFGMSFNDTGNTQSVLKVLDIGALFNDEGSADILTPIQEDFLRASSKVFFSSLLIDRQLRADIVFLSSQQK